MRIDLSLGIEMKVWHVTLTSPHDYNVASLYMEPGHIGGRACRSTGSPRYSIYGELYNRACIHYVCIVPVRCVAGPVRYLKEL